MNPKENQSWIFIGRTSAEAEIAILWPHDAKNWLIGKDPDAGKDWSQEEKGMTEDKMVGWHHRLNRHELEQTLRVNGEQGSLVCCSSWAHKESDTIYWLYDNNELGLINQPYMLIYKYISTLFESHLILETFILLPPIYPVNLFTFLKWGTTFRYLG